MLFPTATTPFHVATGKAQGSNPSTSSPPLVIDVFIIAILVSVKAAS